MNRQQLVVGIVGILVGFILGFFVAMGTQSPPAAIVSGQQAGEAGLPENHPSPEEMEQLQQLIDQASKDPQDVAVRVTLGNRFYDMGRFDAAIPWYEEAITLNPNDLHVSTDLGTSYLYTGSFEKAMERYQKSLQIEPDHPQTLQNMGVAEFSKGNYQKALSLWERLLKVHPDYPQKGDLEEQIETARKHLEVQSSESE